MVARPKLPHVGPAPFLWHVARAPRLFGCLEPVGRALLDDVVGRLSDGIDFDSHSGPLESSLDGSGGVAGCCAHDVVAFGRTFAFPKGIALVSSGCGFCPYRDRRLSGRDGRRLSANADLQHGESDVHRGSNSVLRGACGFRRCTAHALSLASRPGLRRAGVLGRGCLCRLFHLVKAVPDGSAGALHHF